jgi:hypothetical protein
VVGGDLNPQGVLKLHVDLQTSGNAPEGLDEDQIDTSIDDPTRTEMPLVHSKVSAYGIRADLLELDSEELGKQTPTEA